VRFYLKSRLQSVIKILFLSLVILLSGCFGNKAGRQTFVNDYRGIIKEMKSREEVMKMRAESIIAYRKSGFTDVDNAEKAKILSLEVIKLDSISLQHIKSINRPDKESEEISGKFSKGIASSISGNILFAANYGKARDQNIEERKETILDFKPGMKYLAEGLNSIVKSVEQLEAYIKENHLEGEEEISVALLQFKMERDKLAGFL
jgi:hypothetical protein